MVCRPTLIALMAGAAFAAGCSQSPSPPNPGSGNPDAVSQVVGTERLGWTQPANDPSELASLSYAMYVDGVRSDALDASCERTAGPGGFACAARLPPMSAGMHVLELAAVAAAPGGTVESPRSAPLRVNVINAQSSAAAPRQWPVAATVTTDDRVSLRLELLADGLQSPTDIAVAPDRRVFVAEGVGRIRVVRDGRIVSPAAATDEQWSSVLALALAPDFSRSHLLYAIGTSRADGNRPTFWLARFREVADMLGERAILLDGVPAAATASASLRFGDDGKLYAAFDDGDDPALAGDVASRNGKVLRLNIDGTTPADQNGGNPTYIAGVHSPRGMDWDPRSHLLWVADADHTGAARLDAVAEQLDRGKRGITRRAYSLTPTTTPNSTMFYRDDTIPMFAENLFIASVEQRHLLRMRLDPADPTRIASTERLLQDQIGGVRVVTPGPDGAIYVANERAIGRLVPTGGRVPARRRDP